MSQPSELIVLSHLRWDWVWQRPQQLVSRFHAENRRIWFVEEPIQAADMSRGEARLESTEVDGLTRAWLRIPEHGHHVGFSGDVLPDYITQLPELLGPAQGERVVWIYTPLALDAALALDPTVLVYDVMDDLAAFKGAAPELVVRRRHALRRADVVFAGGRSLHRSVVRQGRKDAHLIPSGVSNAHYATAGRLRKDDGRRVAGYVGVLDERLDLDLVAGLADRLPEWTIRMIGPVAKIDPASLPQAPNIEYLGQQEYQDLPRLMAGLDVAIMPFAINEATQSISPTKTLEYLAAGLPVVSTRVPDVVADYSSVVDLRDHADGFADSCQTLAAGMPPATRADVRRLLAEQDWDRIAERMEAAVWNRDERPETPLHQATA